MSEARKMRDAEGDPNSAQLKHAIDSGETGGKTAAPDPAASPLGTDDEAGGAAPNAARVAAAMRQERRSGPGDVEHDASRLDRNNAIPGGAAPRAQRAWMPALIFGVALAAIVAIVLAVLAGR